MLDRDLRLLIRQLELNPTDTTLQAELFNSVKRIGAFKLEDHEVLMGLSGLLNEVIFVTEKLIPAFKDGVDLLPHLLFGETLKTIVNRIDYEFHPLGQLIYICDPLLGRKIVGNKIQNININYCNVMDETAGRYLRDEQGFRIRDPQIGKIIEPTASYDLFQYLNKTNDDRRTFICGEIEIRYSWDYCLILLSICEFDTKPKRKNKIIPVRSGVLTDLVIYRINYPSEFTGVR